METIGVSRLTRSLRTARNHIPVAITYPAPDEAAYAHASAGAFGTGSASPTSSTTAKPNPISHTSEPNEPSRRTCCTLNTAAVPQQSAASRPKATAVTGGFYAHAPATSSGGR